jgi:hypothetical protein
MVLGTIPARDQRKQAMVLGTILTREWNGQFYRVMVVEGGFAFDSGKASLMPTHQPLRPDNLENLSDRRKPAIQLDKGPAIAVCGSNTATQPAPQNNQLMSKRRVFSFKPQLRLEWRDQDGQSETEQPDHFVSLSDPITSSTRMGLSVHTPRRCYGEAR